MSLASGAINETEQASEKLADHITDHIGQDLPGMFRKLLDVLTEYRFVFGVEKKS